MGDAAPQTLETGTLGEAPAAYVPAVARSEAVWLPRRAPGWKNGLLRRMLACADITAALLASLALAFFGSGQPELLAWALLFLPAWIAVAKLLGLYDRDRQVLRHLTIDEVPQLVLWALIGTSLLSLFLEFTSAGRPMASSAFVTGVVAALSVFLLRGLARGFWRRVTPAERVAFVGSASNANLVDRKLELYPDLNMTVVDQRLDLDLAEMDTRDWLRTVDRLVFAPDTLDDEQVHELIHASQAAGVTLSVVPPLRAAFGTSVQLDRLGELPFLEYRTADPSRATLAAKRVLDVVAGTFGLILVLPLFAAVALAIKLDSRGPVLFRQERVGRRGKPFTILKFRTMVGDAESHLADVAHLNRHATTDPRMFKAVDDPRATSVGRFLRRMSLDELPQLVNVVRGEMSLVGPRPLIVEEDRYVTGWAKLRSTVRPGITGLWQVHGASELTFDEMVRLDCEYVTDLSMRRDIKLILRTIPVLLGRHVR
jgi:exopolysaccharide biosynthesis polyprenyl glycosylphosphotransferase